MATQPLLSASLVWVCFSQQLCNSKPCPWAAFLYLGLFQQHQSSTEQVFPAPYLLLGTELGGLGRGGKTQDTGSALRTLAGSPFWALRTQSPSCLSRTKVGGVRRTLLGTRTEPTKYYPDVQRLRSEILLDWRLLGGANFGS